MLEQHVAEADDHVEEIVEVVGNASREPAHSLRLLRLTELILESPPVGDVALHRHEVGDLATSVADGRDGLGLEVYLSALPLVGDLPVPDLARENGPPELAVERAVVRAGTEDGGPAADGLVRGEAREPREGGIDPGDRAITLGDGDRIRRGLERGAW